MRLDECTEYTGFKEVSCGRCGEVTSIKIDAWMLSIRKEMITKMEFDPAHFECSNCGAANRISVVANVELEAVEIESEHRTVVPIPLLRWKEKRNGKKSTNG